MASVSINALTATASSSACNPAVYTNLSPNVSDMIFVDGALFSTAIFLLRYVPLDKLIDLEANLLSDMLSISSTISGLQANKSKIVRTDQKLSAINEEITDQIDDAMINTNGAKISSYQNTLASLALSDSTDTTKTIIINRLTSAANYLISDNYNYYRKRKSVEYMSVKLSKMLEICNTNINNATQRMSNVYTQHLQVASALLIKDLLVGKGLVLNNVVYLSTEDIKNILLS